VHVFRLATELRHSQGLLNV
jgi:hypothetical protein